MYTLRRLSLLAGLLFWAGAASAACPTTTISFLDATSTTRVLCFGGASGAYIPGSEPVSSTGAALDFAVGGAAAPNALVAGGVYNSSPITVTSTNAAALQIDSTGVLKIDCFVNCGIAQGATTSGQNGSLVMGAATTAAPSDTTADSYPLSLDTNGGMRVSPACNKVINIAQTATTDVHTFTGFGYICSITLVSATAQNIGIDEGTGTTCETSGTALIGVSSTSSATPQIALAVNGGFSMASGIPLMKLQASADHLCVLQSSTGEVAGTITYADLTN